MELEICANEIDKSIFKVDPASKSHFYRTHSISILLLHFATTFGIIGYRAISK
jgi:hypothetical protein